MPMAEEAQQYESKVANGLKDGFGALDRYNKEDGKESSFSWINSIKTVAEKTSI
jgi:hypothetical protein